MFGWWVELVLRRLAREGGREGPREGSMEEEDEGGREGGVLLVLDSSRLL